MNIEILEYITKAIEHGLTETEIKTELLNAGWTAEIIEMHFSHAKAEMHKLAKNKDEDINLEKKENASKLFSSTAIHNVYKNSTNVSDIENKSKVKVYAMVIFLTLIALGVFGYYKFIFANPENVWKKFTDRPKEKIFSNETKFKYTDTSIATKEYLKQLPLSNISLEIFTKDYFDISNEQNPQNSSEISYSFKNGNTSVQSGFEYKMLNKKLYINAGNNPFLTNIFSNLTNSKNINWVAIDLEKFEEKINNKYLKTGISPEMIFNPQLIEQVKKLWENTAFVKMDKYLGREKINNQNTLHFTNSLKKEAIKKTLNEILDKVAESFKQSGQSINDEEIETVKIIINTIIDKIEIKQFETWVGINDFKIYKLKIITNAPSLISSVETAMVKDQNSSRDAKRLADIRQMASALELYYNDKKQYPDSTNGQPTGLTPTYIGQIPTAPIPADGNCTEYYNTYWYEPQKNKKDYQLTFCFGANTGGYEAGIHKITSAGVQRMDKCPSTPENCYKNGSAEPLPEIILNHEDEVKKIINDIKFDATIEIETIYIDYEIKKEILAPDNTLDLLDLLENSLNNTTVNNKIDATILTPKGID